MRLIRQRNDLDCGYCVAAMAAGVAYSAVADVDPDPSLEEGLSVKEMQLVLARLGIRTKWKEKIRRMFCEVDSDGIYLIESRSSDGHWVLFAGGKVYDPMKKRPSNLDRFRGWKAVVWFPLTSRDSAGSDSRSVTKRLARSATPRITSAASTVTRNFGANATLSRFLTKTYRVCTSTAATA